MPKLGEPRVMGEVLAGIILGPTVFGALFPSIQGELFASDIVPYIGVAANLGLIFYMFLIGLEVDFAQLRGRLGMTLAISNTSLARTVDARDGGRAAAVHRTRAPDAVPRLRCVHRGVDVGHGFPRAGPDHL